MAGSGPAKTKLAGEFLPLVASRFFPGQPCGKRGEVTERAANSFTAPGDGMRKAWAPLETITSVPV